jgi:hypothetical protein
VANVKSGKDNTERERNKQGHRDREREREKGVSGLAKTHDAWNEATSTRTARGTEGLLVI